MSYRHAEVHYPYLDTEPEWMTPLVYIFETQHDSWTKAECEEFISAYVHGYHGDYAWVDRYVGGIELARAK